MHGEQMLNIFVAEKTATGKTTCCSMMKCINLPTMDYCNIGHLKSLQADGTQNIQISSRFHQSTELYEQDSSPALNRGRTLEERQSLILIKGSPILASLTVLFTIDLLMRIIVLALVTLKAILLWLSWKRLSCNSYRQAFSLTCSSQM